MCRRRRAGARHHPDRIGAAALAVGLLALGAACDPGEPGVPSPGPAASVTPEPPRQPATAQATTVATGLDAPWGLALLPDGRLLVTLRDSAALAVVDPGDGTVTAVGGPGAEQLRRETAPGGEGGLLGVAVEPRAVASAVPAAPVPAATDPGVTDPGVTDPGAPAPLTVFLYRTGTDDNAVVRGLLTLPRAVPRRRAARRWASSPRCSAASPRPPTTTAGASRSARTATCT
ncbi:PQQ-dependent sugar dehydrogenase [Xylanimonas allomyrinae]|uniref:PQQ-dependent sugar dehydrogenase n=1 Tax=Xylanimonas allomyrinae TaxID=2509459 RepID=UPI0014769EA1